MSTILVVDAPLSSSQSLGDEYLNGSEKRK
jgi:hypothetical protein